MHKDEKKQERLDLYNKALEKWGEFSQLDQALEEMAELMVAINKYKRIKMDLKEKKDKIMDNLYEEIADVKMCLEQLEMMFGEENIDNFLDYKIEKFKKCFKD